MDPSTSNGNRIGLKCVVCSIPCERKCSNCWKVGYCGAEHEKLHRKEHMGDCFPLIELKNEKFGSYLSATRKIGAGELIVNDKPLIVGFFGGSTERYPTCFGCCKTLSGVFGSGNQICRKCSWPLCKPDCEKISWHSENECNVFRTQNVKPQSFTSTPLSVLYDAILVVRILLMKEKDKKTFEKIIRLESHVENRELCHSSRVETNDVLNFVRTYCNFNQGFCSNELINKVVGVVRMNSSTDSGGSIVPGKICAVCIYEKSCKLIHSCVPNMKSVFEDGRPSTWHTSRIIAAVDINKGEVLTECYGFDKVYWRGLVERRQGLHQNYFFWCTCARCSDTTEFETYYSAIKCKSPSCSGYYIPVDSLDPSSDPIWKCTGGISGQPQKKYAVLSKIVETIQNEISIAKSVDEKLRILEKHGNVTVHENHFTLMKLRYDLLPQLLVKAHCENSKDVSVHMELCKKIKEFAQKNLEIADKLAPGLSLHRGILLFYLAQGMDLSLKHDGIKDLQVLFRKLEESNLIRAEAKNILKLMPSDSDGNVKYCSYHHKSSPQKSQRYMLIHRSAATVRPESFRPSVRLCLSRQWILPSFNYCLMSLMKSLLTIS